MPLSPQARPVSRSRPGRTLVHLGLGILIPAILQGCEKSSSGGGQAATGVVSHRAEFESIAERLASGDNEFLGHNKVNVYRDELRRPGLTRVQRIEALAELADLHLRLGQVDDAVEQIDKATALAQADGLEREFVAEILRLRGVVYLRQAEIQNCVVRHNRDCCIFPLQGGGVHVVDRPARKARASFEAALSLNPGNVDMAWLLNVLAMALGDYPDAVEKRYRIPPERFAPEPVPGHAPIGRFRDVSTSAGVDTFNLCGGVIADDFDGDGLIDILTSTFDPAGPLVLYRNTGDGRFEDLSSESRLDDQLGGLNCIGADYDNDGDVDVLVLRGAWLLDDGRIRNSLLRNNGDGTFTDVTHAARLAEPARPTQAAVWGDFDNDGDLDLYIVNESRVEADGVSYPAQLFRNNGDGTFFDVAPVAGVSNDRFGKGVTAGDYDNDGDLDIYVSNVGVNRLYRNDGGLRFTDVATRLGVERPTSRSFATWFFDYNNDGWLDLFVVAYETQLAQVALDTMGRPHGAEPPALYRNNGDGTFSDVTDEAGLNHAYMPMGANFGDVDNDGFLDMYLTTGNPAYESLIPNVLLRNIDGRRFVDATYEAGLGHLQKGHGVAFADFDNDGDEDIYHQLGGFYPGDGFNNALFVNPGHGNESLTVRLTATTGNRRAVGARLVLTVATAEGRREIHRAIGVVSSFGGSPLRQVIGLGDATSILQLEVTWPGGVVERWTDLVAGSSIHVTQGQTEAVVVQRKPFTLGAL